jgi:hypothetical protein
MYGDEELLENYKRAIDNATEETSYPIAIIALLVFLVLIAIFAIFHLIKWSKRQSNEAIEIQQKSIDEVDIYHMDDLTQPLVVDYIENDTLEYNMTYYHLYSPLGLFRTYIDIDMEIFKNPQNVKRHYHGVYAIKPSHDVVVVYQTPDRKETSFILVHPYNILFLPRGSHWRIDSYSKISKGDDPNNESDKPSEDPKEDLRIESYIVDTPFTKVYEWIYRHMIQWDIVA